MKKGVLIGMLLYIFSATYSQTKEKTDAKAKLTGKVIDSLSNLPLEYATITLFKQGEKKAIDGTTTNSAGNFTITHISSGTFTIIMEFIGYKPFTTKNVIINQINEVVD